MSFDKSFYQSPDARDNVARRGADKNLANLFADPQGFKQAHLDASAAARNGSEKQQNLLPDLGLSGTVPVERSSTAGRAGASRGTRAAEALKPRPKGRSSGDAVGQPGGEQSGTASTAPHLQDQAAAISPTKPREDQAAAISPAQHRRDNVPAIHTKQRQRDQAADILVAQELAGDAETQRTQAGPDKLSRAHRPAQREAGQSVETEHTKEPISVG